MHVKMTRMPMAGVAATIRVESFPIVAVMNLHQFLARP
jgi:hypothetical protein